MLAQPNMRPRVLACVPHAEANLSIINDSHAYPVNICSDPKQQHSFRGYVTW